jgi:4-amino-4-deoxy-L-arabinose transferase-like glycosyltransferase
MVSRVRTVLAEHPRAEWLIPAGLCLVMLAQMLYSVRQMSQHADEAVHLYAGYRALKCGDYTFGREHPPLAKLLAAAPLLTNNPPVNCARNPMGIGIDEEADATRWLYAQENWWQLLMEARVAASLASVALCLGVWLAARRMFGLAVALVATATLAFEPNILAHGALLLNNVLLSAFFLLTAFCFYFWTERRTVPLLLGTGLFLGLALLTKHSAALLVPVLILLATMEPWLEPGSTKEAAERTWRNWKAVAAIGVVAAVTIWCGYGLHYAGGSRGMEEKLASLNSADAQVLKAVCASHLLPEDYLDGLLEVRGLVDTSGDGSYFLSRSYSQAPWFWFPVTMTVKFTLAFLAMLAMGAAGLIAMGGERRRERLFLLLPAALFLAASMRIGRTIVGIWHLFPMFPFLMILAAAGCVWLARRHRWAGAVLVCLLVLHAGSSLRAYPNYLSYANEAWGGPEKLSTRLPWTDLNQTYWEISRYMEQHPNTPCWVASEWRVPIEPYHVPCVEMGNYWETELPARMKGIVFVSGSWLALWGRPGGPYSPFYGLEPNARLGGSATLVYEGDFDTRIAAARALDNKANRLLKERRHAEALFPAKAAVELSPSTATAHDMYCLALLLNGHPQQALEECATARSLALPDIEGQRLAKGFAEHWVDVSHLVRMAPPGKR